MPLVFVPERRDFFHWGDECPALAGATARGTATEMSLVMPGKSRVVAGMRLALSDVVVGLSAVATAELPALSGSVAVWALACKLALDLVSRERVVPTLVQSDGGLRARWSAALSAEDDAPAFRALVLAMPPAAHAVPAKGNGSREVCAPESTLRAFLDAAVDYLLRGAPEGPLLPAPSRDRRRAARDEDFVPWEERWERALSAADDSFESAGFGERTLLDEVRAWGEPAVAASDRLRACFRLELPVAEREPFVLGFFLQSPDDPSLMIAASEVWDAAGRSLARLGRAFRDPQESLLEALGRAARLFPPIRASLAQATPRAVELDPAAAWQFLSEGAPALGEAGFGVIVPGELTAAGQRRLRLRMRVAGATKTAGAVSGASGLGLDQVLSFDWEAALGDETLSARELRTLAQHKAPLVRHRGEWVVVDPRELREIERRLSGARNRITLRHALAGVLAGSIKVDGKPVVVGASGAFAESIGRLSCGAQRSAKAPPGFRGKLRPYQGRGLGWLHTLAELELGGCLADDMGLGKTVQLLAFLLGRRACAPADDRPALLVAPTSVLGNWEREASRFAPGLRVIRHYGPERPQKAKSIPRGDRTLIVTSYGILRRDAELLASVDWAAVVLDEAQNIKNAASAGAKAARALRATHRFALTGTPVENRLAELWSILEFANPGLLGPLETFRRELALPIERYGNDVAAERLRRLSAPFLLRRLKSDPAVIQDLPVKNEMKVVCTLTREQATLYQAVVDEEMRRIESAAGIGRRGRVLALLLFLKQICNHPAQYLGDSGPLPRRSGKLDRTVEMLDEVLAEGDKALVFTQFREMGDRLVAHFRAQLGVEVVFLHGGTPRKKREEMVQRFQANRGGPPIFVLSVKAGGTGLNLTAANHVFHFDRWWNPAVEDQATDRAYRIGQRRSVQVRKLLCAGTVEEKIDRMLETKRGLASKVIGTGENWITELDDGALRELFSLAKDAAIGDEEEDPSARGPAEKTRRRRAGTTNRVKS